MKNLTVIVYDDNILHAFKVTPLNFSITEEAPHIDYSYFGDFGNIQHASVVGMKQPRTAEVVIGEITKAELDPTTMKRIARYNLEKTNEVLTKEIDFKEAKLERLTEEFERQEKRMANLQEVIKQFVGSGFDTVCEMFDTGNYED